MSAFLLAYGPMLLIAFAGVIVHSVYQRKKSRGIDSYREVAAKLGLKLEGTQPYEPTMTGKIGDCGVLLVRRLVRGQGGEHYETTMRVQAGDPSLSARTQVDLAMRASVERERADAFDRFVQMTVKREDDRWLWLCNREGRAALGRLGESFDFVLKDGELVLQRDAPPVELFDCMKLMAAAGQALQDAAKAPATTLLRNVETATDPADAARAVEILLTRFTNEWQTRRAIEDAARFVGAAPEGEIVARLQLFHPVRAVKQQGLDTLARIGSPAATKYIERLQKSLLAEMAIEASVAIAAIRERYPGVDGGQVSVSDDGSEGALSRHEGEKQTT